MISRTASGLVRTPPAPKRKFNKTLDLKKLLGLANAIIGDEEPQGSPEAEQVEELMLIGTSMGGARPKAVVEDADGLWLAKFNRPDDKWNYARVEHAMLKLASACGLTECRGTVSQDGFQRFDFQHGRSPPQPRGDCQG
jgi:serine/threonine-protein kinase HipA